MVSNWDCIDSQRFTENFWKSTKGVCKVLHMGYSYGERGSIDVGKHQKHPKGVVFLMVLNNYAH